ncbi:DNA polymerase-4 [Lachnospiraceae bacterium YSD2013]|nr:DNA polymerase-4 [Lachnospiraceae bacterium YSD2013]
MGPIFFHIDVNSAFLSWTAVDKLNNGATVDLREVPSIIGGDRETRHGIVTAKSIPAKRLGIETAEPVASALKKCPNLIIESPNFKLYSRMSHLFKDYLYSLTDDVEPASIDECYLYYTPIAHRYESPEACAAMIRHDIYTRFGFTVNVGISDRKVLAKMASDFSKPDKTHTLYSYEIKQKLWPLPVRDLFLCGKSAAATLNKLGIFTIGELARTDKDILVSHLKSHGITLWEFANGIDDSKVETEVQEAKGIGNSTTVARDVTDRSVASDVIYSLCESVSKRLHDSGVLATQVTVEIKYSDFKTFSHQCGTDSPIETTVALHRVSMMLFDRLWNGEPIRLLGVRAGKLVKPDEPYQLSLFSEGYLSDSYAPQSGATHPTSAPAVDTEKNRKLEAALRSIRDRFGDNSVTKGKPNR